MRAQMLFWSAVCRWQKWTTSLKEGPFVRLVTGGITLGPVFSLLLGGVVALPRGWSYMARPPNEVPDVAGLVAGGWVPYQTWGALMMVGGALAVAGVLIDQDRPGRPAVGAHVSGVGHTVLAFCYACLALSSFAGAALFGLPWSSVGGFVVSVLLHFVRVWECLKLVTSTRTERRLGHG